ncbi:hypothetical protein KC207_11325 [Phycicoccus sp. BSK3Z-2]|uniref:Uncharacterized protein n=1 Tax=Phycicoccus avicenniae TaxID=2828860 RepID=A0A941D981_9MICO|nr:hypothetical protein [Phycicoccus avicenniae]MBR7743881.1 hypothetical protein [Phycicoccus avicenniae]
MSVVPGDPASTSACAVTVAAAGRRLAAAAAPVTEAVDDLAEGWGGRGSVRLRRSATSAADVAADTAAELERMSRTLQDHATELAGLLARVRALEDRARAAGLEVREGRVVPPLGIAGEADAAATLARDEEARALRSDLDAVRARHRRRRADLLAALRGSTTGLAAASDTLRR